MEPRSAQVNVAVQERLKAALEADSEKIGMRGAAPAAFRILAKHYGLLPEGVQVPEPSNPEAA